MHILWDSSLISGITYSIIKLELSVEMLLSLTKRRPDCFITAIQYGVLTDKFISRFILEENIPIQLKDWEIAIFLKAYVNTLHLISVFFKYTKINPL